MPQSATMHELATPLRSTGSGSPADMPSGVALTTSLTPSELADKIDISRSAARPYLLTLVHTGMAATDGRLFWLTPKVLTLGRSYLDSARLPRAIVPYLQRLTAQLQESTN